MSSDRQPSQKGRPKVRLSTDVEPELADRVKALARRDQRSISAIAARALARGLDALEIAQPQVVPA